MKFNYVIPFYENQGMLRLQLQTWAAYPASLRERIRFNIVDDGSPEETAEPIIREAGIDADIRLYRTLVDVPWAWPFCRNLMMREIPDGEWAIMTDIDHVLPTKAAERLLDKHKKETCYYVPYRVKADGSPYKQHPNTYVISKDLFWRAGGYSEQFLGYYGTDAAWRRQLQVTGRRVDWDDVVTVLYGREDIPDASTRRYGRKGTEWHSASHPEIRAKTYLTHVNKPTEHVTLPWERII